MPLVRQLHRGFEAKVSGLHERRMRRIARVADSIDEPQVAELTIAMGRRPNHFPPTPKVWFIRYKLLYDVTDIVWV